MSAGCPACRSVREQRDNAVRMADYATRERDLALAELGVMRERLNETEWRLRQLTGGDL